MDFLRELVAEKVEPKDVTPATTYQDQLNPKIWDKDKLRPEVKEKLLQTANTFVKYLKLPDLKVVDIILTGSSANYNWTEQSDIDLHIVADLDVTRKKNPELLDEYLLARKGTWNNTHTIKIYGFDVELYTQDKKEKHTASGMYSIQKDEWVVKPTHKPPTVDDAAVKVKAAEIMNLIDKQVSDGCSDIDEIEKLKEKIKKLRQTGLSTNGEFSIENLAFKTLRNNGYLKKLSDCYVDAFDKKLSL